MFNEVLADNVLAAIDHDMSRWDQTAWASPLSEDVALDAGASAFDPWRNDGLNGEPVTACGARLCFAGHAAVLSGYWLTRDVFYSTQVVDPGTGEIMEIYEAAAKELGIGEHTVLFAARNDRDDLGTIVDVFRDGGDEDDAMNAMDALYTDDCDCDGCQTEDED